MSLTASGSSSGAELAPENGLPTNTISAAASPSPGAPMSAMRPAVAALTARIVNDKHAQVAQA